MVFSPVRRLRHSQFGCPFGHPARTVFVHQCSSAGRPACAALAHPLPSEGHPARAGVVHLHPDVPGHVPLVPQRGSEQP